MLIAVLARDLNSMPFDPEGACGIGIRTKLKSAPRGRVTLDGGGSAHLLIPDYAAGVQAVLPGTGADSEDFTHFGLAVEFARETVLDAYDPELILAPPIRDAIAAFGLCIFRNVRITVPADRPLQKNIFPQLQFHVDRGKFFDNQISLFYRNPDDPAQRPPRDTSTLIMSHDAFRRQARREGKMEGVEALNCVLFDPATVRDAIGAIVAEQPWDAPEGTGELCVFDNRTVVHASYHRAQRGYPISVQYLF